MRGKLMFLVGVGVGYVLGTRAGREKYDELVNAARKLLDHPTVQEASGVVKANASKLYAQGRESFEQSKIAARLRHDATDDDALTEDLDAPHMSTNSF